MNKQQKQNCSPKAEAIESLLDSLKQYAPEGWYAAKGCFLDMLSLSTTGDHVSISPLNPKDGGTNYLERKAKFLPVAEQTLSILKEKGFKASRDGWTVYVFPR